MLKEQIVDNVMLELRRLELTVEQKEVIRAIFVSELVKVEVKKIGTEIMRLEETADYYNKYVYDLFMMDKAPKLSESTVVQYTDSIEELLTIIDKPLNKIDTIDIDHFLRWYKNRSRTLKDGTVVYNSARTVNNKLRFLSAFFTWMRKKRLIQFNPCEATESLPEIKKQVDYFEDYEVEKLRNACAGKRDRALLEFFRSTGARLSEVLGASVRDINLSSGDVTVYMKKRRRYHTYFLDDVAKGYMREYLESRTDNDDALFVMKYRGKTRRMSRIDVAERMNLWKDRAKLKTRVYPHKWRHTLATKLCKQGVDIRQVSQLLGHSSIETTASYYVAVNIDELRYAHHRAA